MEATAQDDFKHRIESKKEVGRPKGSKNSPVVETNSTRCPKCGSSNRTKYLTTRRVVFRGFHKGEPYNSVTFRACRCLECRQRRVDKSYDFIPQSD